jgi:hypothetical protein
MHSDLGYYLFCFIIVNLHAAYNYKIETFDM